MKYCFSIFKFLIIIVYNIFLLYSVSTLANTENETVRDNTSFLSEKNDEKDLKGIEVEFDYQGHEKERQFFYKHYLKEVGDRHPLKREEIGIYLYDIDNDGQQEVLVYLHNLELCGVKGCTFEIFRHSSEFSHSTYQEFSQVLTSWGFLPEIVKILNSVTLGYHDIEIAGTTWKWDGKKYD